MPKSKTGLVSLLTGLVLLAALLPKAIPAYREINRTTALLSEVNADGPKFFGGDSAAPVPVASAQPPGVKPAAAAPAEHQQTKVADTAAAEKKVAAKKVQLAVWNVPSCSKPGALEPWYDDPKKNGTGRIRAEFLLSWGTGARAKPCIAPGTYVHPTLGEFKIFARR